MNELHRVYVFLDEARRDDLDRIIGDAQADWFKDYVQVALDQPTIDRLKAEGFEVYVGQQVAEPSREPQEEEEGQEAAPAPIVLGSAPPGATAGGATPAATESARADPGIALRAIVRPSKRSDPRLKAAFESLASQAPEPAPDAKQRLRLVLRGSLNEERRQQLEALGVKILNFRKGVYQVSAPEKNRSAIAALPFVQDLSLYELLDTVSSDLVNTLATRAEAEATGAESALKPRGCFDALAHAPSDTKAMRDAIAAMKDVLIKEVSEDAVRFTAPFDDPLLASIAALPQVRMLTPVRRAALFVNHARRLIGAETLQQPPPKSLGLTGEGDVIAILDSGIMATHPDFAGRIKAAVGFGECSPDDTIGHGTHVAGIAAGSGAAAGGKLAGMAPKAELVVIGLVRQGTYDLDLPLDLGSLLQEAVDRGARIINCSWGKPVGTIYDGSALSVDRFLYKNPEVLVVFAAGNLGAVKAGEHAFSTVGSPATAKNGLTVAASGTDRDDVKKTWVQMDGSRFPPPLGAAAMSPSADDIALLSSSGPTDTNGVKPDLTAPGVWILGPRLPNGVLPYEVCPEYDDQYGYLHGTSMATPVVAGAAALLRQYLREHMGLGSPTSALMKALLVNATRRLPGFAHAAAAQIGYPDFDQGFGRLDLTTLLPHPDAPAGRRILTAEVRNDDKAQALTSGLSPGSPGYSQRLYRFKVDGSQDSLRIALCWTDWPGVGLQNDIQLLVSTPDGGQIVGNPEHKFDRMIGALDPDTGQVPDRRNTLQQVRIETPQPGEYSVRVWARNTPFPPQGYSLAVCGQVSGALDPTN